MRGFRIEIGEIENTLCRHPGIEAAVVIVDEAPNGDKRLLAYVVPFDSENPPASGAIRDRLRSQLPEYMIPNAIMIAPELPLNANGKVDRAALPKPHWDRDRNDAPVAPNTRTERNLLDLYQSVLNVEDIGIDDDFFSLGGHSIHAVSLFSRIARELDVDLPLADLLSNPTVRQLAVRIEEENANDQEVFGMAYSPARQRPVSIRRSDSARRRRDPLVFYQWYGGNVLLFRDLVQYLDRGICSTGSILRRRWLPRSVHNV
ncbi:MAG: phosphopantetheine-binding protein [Polyangiales bacterium]